MNLNMKRPCANCPFRKEGAIPLRAGRLEDIIAGLLADDGHNFACHKTTNFPRRMRSSCMGSIAYLYRAGHQSLAIRVAIRFGMLEASELEGMYDEILEPDANGMPVYPPSPERHL